MARYREGSLQRELAKAYGVNPKTISAIIKRHGAQRSRGLTSPQIDQAVGRYLEGASLAVIGKAFGVDPGTVRARLLERGVAMRDSHGRDQA